QRQMLSLRADDVELVVIARLAARYEQLPISRAAHAHRVPPRVPKIEVADHADAPRIGREHDKGHAVYAVEHQRMRAELVIQTLMSALGEKMKVEIAQDRRKSIWVFEFYDIVAELCAQLITPRAVRQRASEQASIMNAAELRGFAVLADSFDIGGLR